MEAPVLATTKPYPLMFAPLTLEKVWGGRRLARLGKPLPNPAAAYGECWEIADLAATSASGAGGSAMRSTVAAGPLAGKSIAEASAAMACDWPGAFPLLIKYLDAAQNLSVQVHPAPHHAQRHPDAHLKTESWYIVEADPGASLYIGLKPGITRERFAAALRAPAPAGAMHPAVNLLERIEAVPGRCYTLPSGIIHALGAGVLIAEVQTPSDTPYRLYDWGRDGREMHLEHGLASGFLPDGSPAVAAAQVSGPVEPGTLCARLAETPYYTIDEVRPQDGDELTVGFPCRCAGKHSPHTEQGLVLMVIAGRGELAAAEGSFAPVPLAPGATVLVPHAGGCAREAVLRSASGLRVLRIGFPGSAA